MLLSDIFLKQLQASYLQLGQIVKTNSVSGGFANNNYSLYTTTGNYFLKIIPKKQEQSIPRQLFFYSLIANSKIQTVFPMKNKLGEVFPKINDKTVVLFPFEKIEEPIINEKAAEKIAQLMGEMHLTNIPSHFKIEKSIYGKTSVLQDLDKLDGRTIKTYQKYIPFFQNISDTLPKGFVFDDVCPDNLYAKSGEILGFVDPENAGVGEFLFDIAATTIMCFFSQKNKFDLIHTFLNTYQQYRKLTQEEKDQLFNSLILACVDLSLYFELRSMPKNVEKIAERLSYADELLELGKTNFQRKIQF